MRGNEQPFIFMECCRKMRIWCPETRAGGCWWMCVVWPRVILCTGSNSPTLTNSPFSVTFHAAVSVISRRKWATTPGASPECFLLCWWFLEFLFCSACFLSLLFSLFSSSFRCRPLQPLVEEPQEPAGPMRLEALSPCGVPGDTSHPWAYPFGIQENLGQAAGMSACSLLLPLPPITSVFFGDKNGSTKTERAKHMWCIWINHWHETSLFSLNKLYLTTQLWAPW